ncbi:MAG: hypothetical protein LBK94_13450 [Prevotellaceae bacterium]|jgi:hypothetical protein|nr:hypothetical protein [Prevotellaceae bacterium]
MAKKKVQNRSSKGQFLKGNKEAEKWDEKNVSKKLDQIWDVLTKPIEDADENNPVRANNIKTLAECCLMVDVTKNEWDYFLKKFTDENSAVFRKIKNILWLLEARLIYSGETIDIFCLKNHYRYTDKNEVKMSGNLSTDNVIRIGYK